MSNSVTEEIKKWVVNDYFTPNIKAEVILDALLTPYIADIVKAQCSVGDELAFVTKEMSIVEFISEQDERKKYGNRGTKIDYILADNEFVYLVELKTVSTSINGKQIENYIKNCTGKDKDTGKDKIKTFGTVFGDKLAKIMAKKDIKIESKKDLERLFREWCERYDYKWSKYAESPKQGYAYHAQKLLKENGLYSTKKYLYTIGQILDYLDKYGKEVKDIWDKPVGLIYITPYGDSVLPNPPKDDKGKKKEWDENTKWQSLYVKPNKSESVSLSCWVTQEVNNKKYVKFLKDIIKELYPER